LFEAVFAITVVLAARRPFHSSFHEQLDVIRTRLVLIETVMKRVTEPVEVEILRASMIRPVQKRAMRRRLIMTES
jgi:hypothetical protein